MRSGLTFVTRLYLVLFVLVGVPAGASGAVLCFAADGHVAIEAGGGRCTDYGATTRGEPGPEVSRMLAADCGDCIDIPVGAPVLNEARGRGTAMGGATELAAPLLLPVLAAGSPAAPMPAPSAPDAGSRAAFPPSRTTILRN